MIVQLVSYEISLHFDNFSLLENFQPMIWTILELLLLVVIPLSVDSNFETFLLNLSLDNFLEQHCVALTLQYQV